MRVAVMCICEAVTGHNSWVDIYVYRKPPTGKHSTDTAYTGDLQCTLIQATLYLSYTVKLYELSVYTVHCIPTVMLNYITSYN